MGSYKDIQENISKDGSFTSAYIHMGPYVPIVKRVDIQGWECSATEIITHTVSNGSFCLEIKESWRHKYYREMNEKLRRG